MKKYHNSFPVYGQSIVGRINYLQKMGVAKGIADIVVNKMKSKGLDVKDYMHVFNVDDHGFEERRITAVIPTGKYDWVNDKCPVFRCGVNAPGVVDMILVDDTEIQFHIMYYTPGGIYSNGGWHTVRECMTLEETCTLYEYVDDRLDELVFLRPSDSEKYNSTGTIDVNF